MDQHKLLLNDPPQEVIDGIWVGNHAHANKPNHGFDVVYSIGYEVDDETKYQLEPQKYKFFELGDTSSDDITPILAEIVELLRDDVAMNRKIYVHCQMGQSRSPSVIVAYLVVVKLMCLCKAISTMYERRPSAWINPVFRNQLEAFSRVTNEPQGQRLSGGTMEKIRNASQCPTEFRVLSNPYGYHSSNQLT